MSKGSKVDSPLVITARELGERLKQELIITDWRAVIVLVVAAPALEQSAELACELAMEDDELTASDVVRWEARQDGIGREQLAAINRARDHLLHEKRLIWLRASSAADVRFLRKTAPDLASSIDLFVELRPEHESEPDWPTCRAQLRALMERRHGMLDFTGLLPATIEHRELPLAELYQPLVDPTARGGGQMTSGVPGFLVLGHPGTGKTTYVRHLAWSYARGSDDPLGVGPRVPLLLSLSDYGLAREHDRVRSLVDFLPDWLEQQGVEGASSLKEHLSEILLLLDGLDEIRAPQARHAVLAEVNQILREGRIGGVVITGRSFLVDELGQQDPVLRLVHTREPTPAQIRDFLTRFVKLRRGEEADAENLVSRIEEDADLRALAHTPLMLAFMAILDELEGRLPDRRIEIYYRLGEMLVDRWTRARSLGTNQHRKERPTRADALRVLGPLAWWTVEQGGVAVPEDALSRELERIEAKREGPLEAAKRAAALLDLLRSDTALLVPHPGRRWSFVHSSIGEYFAGVEVERDRKRWSELLEEPFRAEWREIVLFCAGQMGVIEGRMESLDTLVDTILVKSRHRGRYDARYPSLLIGLLKDCPGLSRQQIRSLTERMFTLVFTMVSSHTAAWQAQHELNELLLDRRQPASDSIIEILKDWFSARAASICWDRLFMAGLWSDPADFVGDWEEEKTVIVAMMALGTFTGLLCVYAFEFGLDLQPTLARWRTQEGWRYRFAEWIATRSKDDAGLPFGEVFDELPLMHE